MNSTNTTINTLAQYVPAYAQPKRTARVSSAETARQTEK
jgi:hypothetical protein